MSTNTENLEHLLSLYQKNNKEENLIQKKSEIENNNSEKIKFEYSPEKVEYYQYNGFLYRREINKGNISWEIVKDNISNKLRHDIQIKILEEKISNLGS